MTGPVEVAPLGQFLRRPPRYGINAAAVPLRPGVAAYVRITDIDDHGRFSPKPKVGVKHPSAAKYQLSEGELVFARTGASVGKSYLYDPADGELVYAGFLINIAPDKDRLDPKFLALFAQTKEYWDWVARTSIRSGQPGINGREYASLLIALPSIGVQRSIAQALSQADELVASLERLITKKQALKQGVMQNLLGAKMRLPGFTDEWKPTTFGELGLFLKGKGVKRDDVRSAGIPCIRYGELYTEFIDYTGTTRSFVDASVANNALPIRSGDLLFAGSGETRAEIGMCVAYVGSEPAVAGGDTIVLRGDAFNPIFLATLANMPVVSNQKARAGQGDAVVHISTRALADITISIPSRPEQDAIAKVLVDADQELRLLRDRLQKAREIKFGMMQQLFNGRAGLSLTGSAT